MQRGGGKKKDGTMVVTEDTITNLGTLVIIDDDQDLEDDMDTMKREGCVASKPGGKGVASKPGGKGVAVGMKFSPTAS